MHWIGGFFSIFGLGFLYFVSAIPAGAAMKLPLWFVSLAAWLGYTAGGVVIVLLGEPLRRFLLERFKIQPNPEKKPSLILRAWRRAGLPALGLLAPITIGPQAGTLLGLALGVSPLRITLAISLGVIPWCVGFAAATALGLEIIQK